MSFSIDRAAFRCTADDFGEQCAEAGIPGIGTARYYLMSAACAFLQEKAAQQAYPYSLPPASRTYEYSVDTCPNARDYLDRWLRWSTFCEKCQLEDCGLAAAIVREVADRNRV
ncbi:MAG: hypothetical protein CL878_09435 [Dehalococcoidia bacterium]|nr:hypothetical protein [Dehalococcoidia bacterium]